MRLLFVIPHCFRPDEDGRYGSTRKDPRPRLFALATAVHSLHQLFGPSQVQIDVGRRVTVPANLPEEHQLSIVLVTTRGLHLVEQLGPTRRHFEHRETDVEPMLLGFEAHRVLAERRGQFDYCGYLEDDLICHDPWLFAKLAWFERLAGDAGALLLPNRYEVAGQNGPVEKAYIDGDLLPRVAAPFQDVSDRPTLDATFLDRPIVFRRALNPHSGCFFLSARQFEHWARQPFFLDRDTSFIGPLESAASLGIMRAFRVYKPARENAAFLEIQHFGTSFLGLIGNVVKRGAVTD